MLDKIVHTLTPALVIAAATVLVALRRIDSATGVSMILAAGGVGAVAVGVASKRGP